jgi:hypothetical protein
VKTNKNDYIDAEAIAEAVTRPSMRFVPIKTDDQLDLQSLHRVRERWVGRRTAVINQIRGLLLERGITVLKGRRHIEQSLPGILEDPDNKLSGALRVLLTELRLEMQYLHRQIEESDKLIVRIANELEPCRRLVAIPGIGPVIATATIAAIGNGAAFRKGRGFAAWLGVVPGEHSTGGKQKLTDMSQTLIADSRRRACSTSENRFLGDSEVRGSVVAASASSSGRTSIWTLSPTESETPSHVDVTELMARRLHSPHKGRIHLRRSVAPLFAFSLQSEGGPYIQGTTRMLVVREADFTAMCSLPNHREETGRERKKILLVPIGISVLCDLTPKQPIDNAEIEKREHSAEDPPGHADAERVRTGERAGYRDALASRICRGQ